MNEQMSHEFRVEEEIEKLYLELNSYLRKNHERVRADVEQFEGDAARSGLMYAGMPLAVGVYPVILSEAQTLRISGIAEATTRLMERVTELFLREPEVRKVFDFGPEQTELIEVDPG